tara:strand:- start:22544 stop:23935 length:1392 start_codon:yes stop_codon:yes gene_type:complete
MFYISTRDSSKKYSFQEILLKGLAPDGGLYIPETIPKLSDEDLIDILDMDYQSMAFSIIQKFIGSDFSEYVLQNMISEAYSSFTDKRITPVVELDQKTSLLELFHGPTLAFKDIAMQLLARMIEEVLLRKNQKASVICATSGDTGGAAVSAFANKNNIDVFVLFPKDRISEVQRRFMTTNKAKNMHIISINGNFDDCQKIVKSLFADASFSESVNLTTVNSINWARIMIQVVYYFSASAQIKKNNIPPSYVVPTGNFGDIYAGYIAKKMGLKIKNLVIATNVNNILDRCLRTGKYDIKSVVSTNSPSMDIQISSNFERLLYDILGSNTQEVEGLMKDLHKNGYFNLSQSQLSILRNDFSSGSVDENNTLRLIKFVKDRYNKIIDPHTAVAFGVNEAINLERSVILSTAHPAKFPETIKESTGVYPDLPENNKNIYKLSEQITELDDSIDDITRFILSKHESGN